MEQITIKHLQSLEHVNEVLREAFDEHSEKNDVCFNVHISQENDEYELNLGFYKSVE